MVISRCQFNRRITTECYGQDTLNLLGSRIIISSGAALGTRDAIISWSHHLTLQLQEAPGRLEETRCVSGGIDHAFINWLSYNNKVRLHSQRCRAPFSFNVVPSPLSYLVASTAEAPDAR